MKKYVVKHFRMIPAGGTVYHDIIASEQFWADTAVEALAQMRAKSPACHGIEYYRIARQK